ncbi:MAG: hypothetical protein WCG10_04600 [Chlamydiota bacterium]
MYKKLMLFSLIILNQLVLGLTLKERFQPISSKNNILGNFIVTEHQKNLSFLRVHSFLDSSLFLEEINLPIHLAPKKPIFWDEWVEAKAPGHTSWLLYQINLDDCKILDCYSFSRQSYIALSDGQSFLSRLMTLPLTQIALSERKRIGPPPTNDMPDTRKLWNPPKIYHGQKIKNPHFEMLQASWPKDESEFSGKLINLYFDQDHPEFTFPYWIEIGDGYNLFQMHAIDSGKCLIFPYKQLPCKSPCFHQITLNPQKDLIISLKNATHLHTFQLIASSASGSIVLPYTLTSQNSLITLTTSHLDLTKHVQKQNRYTIHLIPIDDPSLAIESSQTFLLFP